MAISFEDPADSCRTIIEFIKQHHSDGAEQDAIRIALLEDLCWKAAGIKTLQKSVFLAQGMYYSLPPHARRLFPPEVLGLDSLGSLPGHIKPHKNVGIVTVLKAELDAVQKVFRSTQERTGNNTVFSYWPGEVERADGGSLSAVITVVGHARNVPCAIAVDELLSRYSVDLMMLIGIAAGPREKVELGDVVAANWVYDYEHVRREKLKGRRIEKPRPFHIPVPKNIGADLELYEEAWFKRRLKSVLAEVDAYTLPVAPAEINPKFHIGTIAAGEKLFADNGLDELRNKYDDEIRAGDQEDSGFAQACDFRDVPWCIFRGISDYGDATKNKEWHSTASLAAASAAYAFLQHAFRLNTEGF